MRPMRAATGCEFEAASETGRVMQTGSDLGYGATTGDLPWNPDPNILTHKSPCEPDREQPVLPMMPGIPERRTHSYIRHGTTSLFAALDIASGFVIGKCYKRHRAAEFLDFLKQIDARIPDGLDVHIIMDNYATHKTAVIKTWLARRPHYHVHFTPTSASWINQVERWFAELTRKQLRRGVHTSTKQLETDIRAFIERHNQNPKPYRWTKSADEILASVKRFCQKTERTLCSEF